MEKGRNVWGGVRCSIRAGLRSALRPSREIRRESCSERWWRRAWAHDGSAWERRYLEASDLSISLPVRPTTYWNLCFIHFSLERLRKKKNSPGIHQFKKYISLHYGVLSYFKLSPLLFVWLSNRGGMGRERESRRDGGRDEKGLVHLHFGCIVM